MILLGWNTLVELMLGHRQVTKVNSIADHAYGWTKGGRECVEDIHSWFEPLDEPLIAFLRLIEVSGFRFKYREDVFGRSAAVYFRSEWVGSQVLPGLLLILL